MEIEFIETKEKTIEKRLENAITSILENRYSFFLPINQLKENSKIFKDFKKNKGLRISEDWGSLIIKNSLLTQKHKNILEAMLSYPKTYNETYNSFQVTFFMYDFIKNKLYKKNPAAYYASVEKYIDELSDCSFEICTFDNFKIKGIRLIEMTLTDDETKQKTIIFSPVLKKIWQRENLLIIEEEARKKLMKIKDGTILAIIRYLITYKSLQISLTNLLDKLKINYIFKKTAKYKKIKEIRESFKKKEYQEIYKEFGIEYDEKNDLIKKLETKEENEENENKVFIIWGQNKNIKTTFTSKLSTIKKQTTYIKESEKN